MVDLKELSRNVTLSRLEADRGLTEAKQRTFKVMEENATSLIEAFNQTTSNKAASEIENFVLTESTLTSPDKWKEKFNELSVRKAEGMNPVQRAMFSSSRKKAEKRIEALAETEQLKRTTQQAVTNLLADIGLQTSNYAASLEANGFTEEGYEEWQQVFAGYRDQLGADLDKIQNEYTESLFNSLLYGNQFDDAAAILNRNISRFKPERQRTLLNSLEGRIKTNDSVQRSMAASKSEQVYKQAVKGTPTEDVMTWGENNGFVGDLNLPNLWRLRVPELYTVREELLRQRGSKEQIDYVTDRISEIQKDLSNENIFGHYNIPIPSKVNFAPAVTQNGKETQVDYELLKQIISNDLFPVLELGGISSEQVGSVVSGVSQEQRKILRQGLDNLATNQKVDTFQRIDVFPRGEVLLKELMYPREWEMRKLGYNQSSTRAEKAYDQYTAYNEKSMQNADRNAITANLAGKGILTGFGDYDGLIELIQGSKQLNSKQEQGGVITDDTIDAFMANYHAVDSEIGVVWVPGKIRKFSVFEKIYDFVSAPFGRGESEEVEQASTLDDHINQFSLNNNGFVVEKQKYETEIRSIDPKSIQEQKEEIREEKLAAQNLTKILDEANAFYDPVSSSEYQVKYYNTEGELVTLTDEFHRPFVVTTDGEIRTTFSNEIVAERNKIPLRDVGVLETLLVKSLEAWTRTGGRTAQKVLGSDFRTRIEVAREDIEGSSGFATTFVAEGIGFLNPIDYVTFKGSGRVASRIGNKIIESGVTFGAFDLIRNILQTAEREEEDFLARSLANSFAGGTIFGTGLATVGAGFRKAKGSIAKKGVKKKQQNIVEKVKQQDTDKQAEQQEEFLKDG